MARHWTERLTCSCGFWTYDYAKEARHRHNFPVLCRKGKKRKKQKEEEVLHDVEN